MQMKPADLRWCFSTLGCADASLAQACAMAAEHGMAAIELRALGYSLDLPGLFADSGWTPAQTQAVCRQAGVALAIAGSSFKLVSADPAQRSALVRFCGWADALGIAHVRVFGGGTWGTPLTDEDFRQAVRNMQWWHAEKSARGWQLDLLLETHDAFAGSGPCLRLNALLPQPLNLVWDTHHSWRYASERPEHTWRQIGPWVRHVHFKDSVDRPSARHPYTYVLCGDGQMPLADTMQLLREHRFSGAVSLEWERHWHPYLPPLAVALAGLRRQPWFCPPSL